MTSLRVLSVVTCAVGALTACSSDAPNEVAGPTASTVLDLKAVKTAPTDYAWFDFRPNVKKLILSGAAETQHVAILWYTVADGSVGLHYHSKTESVYVIDGTQTDAKGMYPTGTVYFNPPGSGHEIKDSSGFFVLAYASPPDFASTDRIEPYSPVRIDTEDPDLMSLYPFEEAESGVQRFAVPLDAAGGLGASLIEIAAPASYDYPANYLLVLKGSCDIDGKPFPEDTLVVAKSLEPQPYTVSAPEDSTCLAMGVSFQTEP